MIAVGVDTHKESHFVVALDHLGQVLGELKCAPLGIRGSKAGLQISR